MSSTTSKNLLPEIVVPPPGPRAQAIIARDERVSSPSYIKEYPLVVDRGEGPWIYDVDGNRYLDFMAGIAVASTGHAHPKVVQAIQASAAKFLHICATDFYYESFAATCEKLAGYVPEMGKKRVFLTNSGTEAVEGAIKLARYHTKRHGVVAFRGGFHGRTLGAISLTSSKVKQRAHFGPLLPGVAHVDYPNPYRGVEAPDFDELFHRHVDPSEIAAVFVEPILGEGGYVVPPAGFLQTLRAICDRHGIVLVFDEIQTGIGRTGRMFAAEHFGVFPDVLLAAKGLASGMPLGAIIARESVMTWPKGSHGSTFGGNPVCCAAALATLEVVEGLLPHVRACGESLTSGLKALQARYPRVGDVRGPGYMVGVEFVEPGSKRPASEWIGKLEKLAFSKGLLLLSCGQSTIRIAPPLVAGEHEIAAGLDVLGRCLDELR
jgi:4-aminobutyrate aminotransferase